MCSYRQRIAISRQAGDPSENSTIICISGLDIGLLGPGTAAAGEDIDRTRTGCRIVGLIAIDVGGVAVLTPSSYRQRIAVSRQTDCCTSEIAGTVIDILEILQLLVLIAILLGLKAHSDSTRNRLIAGMDVMNKNLKKINDSIVHL